MLCLDDVIVMFKRLHVFRIKPNKDLFKSVVKYCEEHDIKSAIILGIIGSLKNAKLGFLKTLPGKYIKKEFNGPLEIVNAHGSVAVYEKEVITHIHVCVGNEKQTFAGHLLPGSIVFSTAEVVILELWNQLKREKDAYTGLFELV